MKTYEQLMKHYWGVIVPMAEAAGINPWECVRYKGNSDYTGHPRLDGDCKCEYTFAITGLEGKPVFEGDKVYSKETGMKIKVMAHHAERYLKWESMTWTPHTPKVTPNKRTFMLNGKELPCPVNKITEHFIVSNMKLICFDSKSDKEAVSSAINNILIYAQDKE